MDSKKQEFEKRSKKRENINESNPLTLDEVFDYDTEFMEDITTGAMEFCDVVSDNEIKLQKKSIDDEMVGVLGNSSNVEIDICLDEHSQQEFPHVIYIEGIPFEVDFTCDVTIPCEVFDTNDISPANIPLKVDDMLAADIPFNADVSDGMLATDIQIDADTSVDAVFGINREIKYDTEFAECMLAADDENVTIAEDALFHEDTTDDILGTGSEFSDDISDNEDYAIDIDISDGAVSVDQYIPDWHTQCIDEFVASNVNSIVDRDSWSQMNCFQADSDVAEIDRTFEQLDEIEPSCLWLSVEKEEIVE